jgi:hypothetical protein
VTTATPKTPPEPEAKEAEQLPPLLDIKTLAPKRATITIDGEAYEVRRMGDFGIQKQHEITSWQREYNQIWEANPADLKPEQAKRLGLLLDKLIRSALDAPKAVIDKLDDEYRRQIVDAFISRAAQSLQIALAQVIQEYAQARTSSTSES